MTCLLASLYVAAAIAEGVGIGLAVYEILTTKSTITRARAAAGNEHGMSYGEHPRTTAAFDALFVTGRRRRMLSIALVGIGVLLGLAGNLIALFGQSQ